MNRLKGALQTFLVYMAMASLCLLTFSLEGRNIGLFYNSNYLDIIDGDLFAEASNLKVTLEYLGHNVITFEEITDIENINIDVLIIPELEKLSLLDTQISNQLPKLQSYIENGGGLILMGVVASETVNNNNALDLMNEMLGTQLTAGEPVLTGTCTKSSILLPEDFSNAPDVIENNNAIVYLKNGFVEGTKIIYHNTERLSDVAVAQFPLGEGSIVYFGWGWWNAYPVGTQDGGWLALLDETIEVLTCNQVRTDFDDFYTFSLGEDGHFVLSEDEFKTNIKSCTSIEIQLSKTEFDCDDVSKVHKVTIDLMNESGWHKSLTLEIEIIDPNNYCDLPQGFFITGEVENAAGMPISDVVLSLTSSGETVDALVSDDNGHFLTVEPILGSYLARLDKDVSTSLAITAKDLRALNRHLLGIERFSTPHQYIAADMNGDRVLNVMDEILLRRILLHGLQGDEVFAPVIQFVSKSYFFRPRVNPLLQNWNTLQGTNIDVNNHNLEVIAIKLGDIDFSFN